MISRNIGMAISFVAGVAIGVLATYKIADQKYRNIANEEIDSVIERFSNREPKSGPMSEVPQPKALAEVEVDDVEEEDRFADSKVSMAKYKSTVEHVGYDKISQDNSKPNAKKGKKKKAEVEEEVKPTVDPNLIYVISPDEYNTLDGFSAYTLYYSADNQVLDSDCVVLSEIEVANMIGHDPYGHFGEYEDDSVHIRNEALECDYEILLSMKTADEIRGA